MINSKLQRPDNRQKITEARQKLFTKAVENALSKYPLYSQDGKGVHAKVIARFFGGSSFTCYVTEGDVKTGELYGLTNLGYGFEWGYFTRQELEKMRFRPFGLPLERDISIDPLEYTLEECMKQYNETLTENKMKYKSHNLRRINESSLEELKENIKKASIDDVIYFIDLNGDHNSGHFMDIESDDFASWANEYIKVHGYIGFIMQFRDFDLNNYVDEWGEEVTKDEIIETALDIVDRATSIEDLDLTGTKLL